MTVLKMAKYTDDDMRLKDLGDAEFLKRKIKSAVVLDFTDVSEISPEFLDILLKGESPESLGDRVTGMTRNVDAALAAWVDRNSGPVTTIERPRPRPKVRRPKPALPPTPIEREPLTNDRFTPTRLFHRLENALRGYIESAYPLSDSVLVRTRRKLLETEANGHLLAQEPFIETTTRYATSSLGYADLGLPDHVGTLLNRLAGMPTQGGGASNESSILYASMYEHQERSFRSFLVENKDIVVATGTGSGKTECFLVPMLGSMYDEAVTRPDSFEQRAVRALVLYPMNALVNDQLSRLRLLFGEPDLAEEFKKVGCKRFPSFGMYTGRTPYPGKRKASRDRERVAPLLKYYQDMDPVLKNRLQQLGRYPAKDLQAFSAEHEVKRTIQKTGLKAGKQRTQHNWGRRFHTGSDDRELLTRHEMIHGVGTLPGHSPDILITNYSMLEYMLMRPFERPIFNETQRWLQNDGSRLILVLDEAHMYRGAKGAEVAFLLRRLRARLGIHDKPEKLRVIATSASLGSDSAVLENICKFTADLTGKTPKDFEAVTGTREILTPVGPATAAETDMFVALDLDSIHQAHSGEALLKCLSPVLDYYSVTCTSSNESDVLAALYESLEKRPFVNHLLSEAAGSAKSISYLADSIFPGTKNCRKALETLLTLGTLARKKNDAIGLVPTRVHGMFRGLHGLYACINPTCAGRQVSPGEKALLGKLFSYPQATCDVCGSRVFELASCRSCGSPYLFAYAETGKVDQLEFLWGETEGNLVRVELLPSQPRYPERTEQLRAHLQTGYLDPGGHYPDEEVRNVFLWLDTDGKRQLGFERCAMCQPPGPGKSRIYDFRTRGEQPFTALIEAQFAEQPPQKLDSRLPNHGRKVLVFSDGRQKAARLAPALEHSHARDLFRQLISLAAHELREQEKMSGMHQLYPGVVWLCAKYGYDLFPSADEVEFHNQLRRVKDKSLKDAIKLATMSGLRPTKSFAKALFSELTDRYYSVTSLAIGTVEEDPVYDYVFEDFPNVGLDLDAEKALLRAWIRLHLERRSFKTDGAELSELGEGWAGPVGINAERLGHVLPNRFEDYICRILDDDMAAADQVANWFQKLVRNSDLLVFDMDLYYLQPWGLSLNLKLDEAWLRCLDCGRIHPESLADVCPACLGELVTADPAYLDSRTGFYRDQVQRAFDKRHLEPFGLSAAEHSAQLTGQPDESAFNRVEEYELRFQDIALDGKPPIDVLSCTTTMEVGIDIGALSGVALRNVPPHVANYQQRAGRAGRRGRSIASVITYAHGTSHDAHFFDHPEAIISGDVRPPTVYVENQQVLERHIHAYLVQRFFHERVPSDTRSNAYMLFESLGTVDQFLSEAHPCSLLRLESWLSENQDRLQQELRHWVPTYSYGLGERIPNVEQTIVESVPRLQGRLRSILPVDKYPNRDEIEGLEREVLERRLEETLLVALINHAVLPRYAFPLDVVNFWVSKTRHPGDLTRQRVFMYEPQRDLQLALTEYAPGRSLTIDKWRFASAALFSPYEPTPQATLSSHQPYTACRSCTYVSLDPASASLTLCPCCASDQISHAFFIKPAGFAPDISEKWEIDRGQPIVYAGMTDRARLELQDPPDQWDKEFHDERLKVWTGSRMLAIVNKGVGDRGFRVCPDCGRAEPEYGPGFTTTKLTRAGIPIQHRHPLDGSICPGIADGPFFLGHRFLTDTLLLRMKVVAPIRLGTHTTAGLLSRAARMALTSLVEAISLAASRQLQIEEGELSGWWAPVLGGRTDEAQLYLYDLLPGGAGYARAVGQAMDEVLQTTEALLLDCDCTSSCYRCIRHWGNNYIQSSLDRYLALDLLRHIRHGVTPEVTTEKKRTVLHGLCEYLRLRGIEFEVGRYAKDVEIPLVVNAPGGEIWVDVHHALVDPALKPSDIAIAAQSSFQELVEIDAHTLVHDLPSAVARLQVPDGAN